MEGSTERAPEAVGSERAFRRQQIILPESILSVTSRAESYRAVLLRAFPALSWIILLALASGSPLADLGLVPSAYARDQDAENSDSEKVPADEDKNGQEKNSNSDQDAAEKETKDRADSKEQGDAPPVRKKKPSGKKSKSDEEEVDAAQAAADREEDEKAAAEEAEGVEVEIDESEDEEEEESEDSEESPDKRPVMEDEKQPDKEKPAVQKRVIGATATIMEKQSELLFSARVDSGAKSCSLHIEDYKIEDEAEKMRDNIGKVITFHIKNGNNESHWLPAKIAGYVIVKTSSHRERRYKVPLTLRYKDFEKTVLVTLNNREKMEFPLLLGRNFLMGDFCVDVEVDNDDLHVR